MKDHYPYIPEDYRKSKQKCSLLYFRPDEVAIQVEFLQVCMEEVLPVVKRACCFENRRQIALCCFHSNEEARACLDRPIDGTMAMAPYSDEKRGLIIVQSGAAGASNLDAKRMKRVLAHEICHLFVSEISGAKKILGDGNKNIIVPSWLDEGFAEVVSNTYFGDPGKLSDWLSEFQEYSIPLTFEQLSAHLDDLWSDLRGLAFVYSSALVYGLAEKHGINFVFHNLFEIAKRYTGNQLCSPETAL